MISSQMYAFGRWIAGNVVGSVIWAAIWLANGYFTVVGVTAFGTDLAQATYPLWIGGAVTSVGLALSSAPVAWLLHIAGSTVEGLVWYGSWDIWMMCTYLIVMFLDVGTTFAGSLAIRDAMGWNIHDSVLVLGAIFLAMVPEAAIVAHARAMGIIK